MQPTPHPPSRPAGGVVAGGVPIILYLSPNFGRAPARFLSAFAYLRRKYCVETAGGA